MKTEHTQGEWTVKHSNRGAIVIHDPNGSCIADCNMTADIKTEKEANARLIASAPELIEMVYRLMQSVKRLSEDDLDQFDRDHEAQWIGEAHELLYKINPEYNK